MSAIPHRHCRRPGPRRELRRVSALSPASSSQRRSAVRSSVLIGRATTDIGAAACFGGVQGLGRALDGHRDGTRRCRKVGAAPEGPTCRWRREGKLRMRTGPIAADTAPRRDGPGTDALAHCSAASIPPTSLACRALRATRDACGDARRRGSRSSRSLRQFPYAAKSPGLNGRRRTRFPVSAKSALASAGATGGVPGSPMPVGFSLLETR
jgi:hypothetical protein